MPRYRTGKRPDVDGLLGRAAERGGLFTIQDAAAHGVSRQLLSFHTKAGRLERVARGLYRSKLVPRSRHEEILERVVAAGPGAIAAGPTALDIASVGELMPENIYLRVPLGRAAHLPKELEKNTVVIADDRPVSPTERDGVPMESIADAVVSTASYTRFDSEQIGRVVDSAAARGLVDRQDIRKRLKAADRASDVPKENSTIMLRKSQL